MAKRPTEILAVKSEWIDPTDCGSIIGYRIYRSDKYLTASMTLSDCHRIIEWWFNSDSPEITKNSLEKIDNAIRILTEFKKEFVKATKGAK